MMIDLQQVVIYLWLLFVAFVGGVLGYIRKHGSKPGSLFERLRGLAFGCVASMFVAYIIFQLALYYIGNIDVAIALAGVAAWMGTDALVALESALLALLQKGERR